MSTKKALCNVNANVLTGKPVTTKGCHMPTLPYSRVLLLIGGLP